MSSKCAIVGRVCPETADPSKPWYCPHWKDAIPEITKDGTGRVVSEQYYRGCFLRREEFYLLSMAAEAGHSAASADKMTTELSRLESKVQIHHEAIKNLVIELLPSYGLAGLLQVQGGEEVTRLLCGESLLPGE